MSLVLVDMDGVLAGFDEAVILALRRDYPHIPIVSMEQRREFHVSKDYPEEHRTVIRQIITKPGFFLNLPPLPSALVGIRQLSSMRHHVFICTTSITEFQHCVDEKFLWVESNLGAHWTKKIIITPDKTLVYGDYLIDDKPEVTGLINPPPWQHLLYARPYNQDVSRPRFRWDQLVDFFSLHPA